MTSQIFSAPGEKVFGRVYHGRYHMPLLPGEQGVKSGGDWVPGGLSRVTTVVGAISNTRALNVWEQGMGLIGLALASDLYEELVLLVHKAREEGTNFERLRDYPELKEALAGAPHDQGKQEKSLFGRAKEVARASAGAQRGTNRHAAWEHRGAHGELIGTPAIRLAVGEAERLLREAGLIRVAGLSERAVRNVEINAVGRFDDIVMEAATGQMFIADLKTQSTPWFSMTEVDAQLAAYARAEWMLTEDGQSYEPGPLYYVSQDEGVILHVPSDGAPASLDRADLQEGWRTCQLAAEIIKQRAYGTSVARKSRISWVGSAQPVDL